MEERQVLRWAVLLTAAMTILIFFTILITPQPVIKRMPDQYQIVTGIEINNYVYVIMQILIVLSILGMAFLSFFGTSRAGAKEEK
jgi:Mg2+/Co2+ transporter CorB